ncbi:hypothetical protein SDC9_156997 [bioreactor metagenome]|uniref:Uncharacterized protein n=1 Tax=bioreactor metagenome TaxID=1076179 RepID=A0A645F5T4_9ZZZZ
MIVDCRSFLPVSPIFSAFTTTTKSPVSTCGVYVGLCFPISIRATCTARRPRCLSVASITYHLRSTSAPLAMKERVPIMGLPPQKKWFTNILSFLKLLVRFSEAVAYVRKRTALQGHCLLTWGKTGCGARVRVQASGCRLFREDVRVWR